MKNFYLSAESLGINFCTLDTLELKEFLKVNKYKFAAFSDKENQVDGWYLKDVDLKVIGSVI